MSWAANFVATLQNTFNSHGTHKIRCSFNTIIIINVKWKKGTRTLATNEEWKKRANTETRSLSLSLARWIKRAKPIEEWVLSFRKHARKTYTAKQRWRFYQRLFCSYFSFSHWRLWWLLLLLLLFGFLKDGARPSFFHSFVVFFSILRFPCTFWLAFSLHSLQNVFFSVAHFARRQQKAQQTTKPRQTTTPVRESEKKQLHTK